MRSKRGTILSLVLIFSLLFLCNILTGKLVDDYAYMYSWDTGEKITNVLQIFPSMAAHAQKMNGRLVAHFFAQLFDFLPKTVFNIVNAAVFSLLIGLMYRLTKTDKPDNLLLLGLFGGVWLFVPAFGQVCLWLDGSCNYLWGVVAGLLFILPFAETFLYDRQMPGKFLKILFVPYSFLAGAYSENISAAFLLMAGLIVLILMIRRKKILFYYCGCICVAFLGYLSILMAPAERIKKGVSTFQFSVLRENFIATLQKYKTIELLWIVFVVMFILAYAQRISKERLILSLVFLAGSLCCNYLMMAAAYYPDRCLIGSVVLLIMADALLISGISEGKYRLCAVCAVSLALLYTAYYIPIALNDIYVTGSDVRANEEYILECKEKGITEITVPMPNPRTKYSALYGVRYLATDTADTWPNASMAQYYGVKSIIGKW